MTYSSIIKSSSRHGHHARWAFIVIKFLNFDVLIYSAVMAVSHRWQPVIINKTLIVRNREQGVSWHPRSHCVCSTLSLKYLRLISSLIFCYTKILLERLLVFIPDELLCSVVKESIFL
jgi:hypothetical protein